jgi:hypothetical protein
MDFLLPYLTRSDELPDLGLYPELFGQLPLQTLSGTSLPLTLPRRKPPLTGKLLIRRPSRNGYFAFIFNYGASDSGEIKTHLSKSEIVMSDPKSFGSD